MAINDELNPFDHIEKEIFVYEAGFIHLFEFWKPVMKEIWGLAVKVHKKRHMNRLIFGNTNSGKTSFNDFILPQLKKKLKLGNYKIIDIRVTSEMTAAGLYKKILKKLNWDYPIGRRNREDYEPYLIKACEKRKPKFIVIDEVSELYDGDFNKQVKYILKSFKNLPEITGAKVILIGTWKLLKLLDKDKETKNRYPHVQFPRFSLQGTEWKKLQQLLKTLASHIKNTVHIDTRIHEDGEAIIYLASITIGKLGAIISIFEKAVELAYYDNKGLLTLDDHIIPASQILEKQGVLYDDDYEIMREYGEPEYFIPNELVE